MSNVSPVCTVISWVGSVGSGSVVGVSAVGGRVAVGTGVEDNAEQLVSRRVTATTKKILFIIMISMNKYT
jgi:hypothetical protein